MNTLKTMIMAVTLALAPASAAFAQDAAPAPAPAAAAAATAQTPAAPAFEHLKPEAGIGQPIPGSLGLQPQVTDLGRGAKWFHNDLLLPLITVVSLFVLLLLIWVVIRYRAAANPNPSRTSHNTLIEIIWTLAPVLILLFIAVPSIRLLAHQYAQPKPDVTIKVIGNQWYWTYQYPDNGDFELVSNMLPDAEAKKRGEPRMLAVDERLVVPAGKVVKVITTSNDVIHSFAVPAFWIKMDAVPGRLNETWFKVDRPGVYYGQCSELCGARHGFMPIAVEVVPPARFAEWVKSKGGKMPGEVAPAAAAPAAEAPAATPAAAPAAPAATPPVTSQPATQN
ncbi:cytochrome c oxidase subunit II [Sphingomonas sp. YR710]|uniref:cytochrome c oxidase subunit II n=1 Tax=Sphingomonas sp. YR710 TaxID=1882773 RepID=UPI000B889609|nr:cytochrome c oxidase subunit II [Sphingomonas sp. YR710]